MQGDITITTDSKGHWVNIPSSCHETIDGQLSCIVFKDFRSEQIVKEGIDILLLITFALCCFIIIRRLFHK